MNANQVPVVAITGPADGTTVTEGTGITFTGTASDPEDGDLTASLAWSSDLDDAIGIGGSFSTPTLRAGVHTITASATDSGGLVDAVAITVTVSDGSGETVQEIRVSASSDDAEERVSGSVKLTSSDLELVFDRSDQTVGMRFNGVGIPRCYTVLNGFIQFQVDEASTGPATLTIHGQRAANAGGFLASNGNISSRPTTFASVSWSPVEWPIVRAAGTDQRTPNIASIIQEIVDLPNWAADNSVVIIIDGTGERTAEAFNGVSAAAPLLHLEYAGPTSCN